MESGRVDFHKLRFPTPFYHGQRTHYLTRADPYTQRIQLPSSAKSKLVFYYINEHPDSHVKEVADTLELSFLKLYSVLRVLKHEGNSTDTANVM
jgi:hypothetical protein